MNDAGQVAYYVNLADGSRAGTLPAVAALPRPFGGSWDNGNNWTLGITRLRA
jgi:hypothetical protein